MGAILPDHNGGVTHSVIVDYVRKLSAADKKKKEIAEEIKKIETDAKDDGLNVKDLREAIKESKGDPQEYIERQNRKAHYLRALKAPLGDALPRIEDFDHDMVGKTEEELQEIWVNQGYQAGLRADNRDTCPHAADSIGFNCWMEGYQKGQGENLDGIKGTKPKKPAKSKAPPAPPVAANDPAPEPPIDDSLEAGSQDGSGGTSNEDWDSAAPK